MIKYAYLCDGIVTFLFIISFFFSLLFGHQTNISFTPDVLRSIFNVFLLYSFYIYLHRANFVLISFLLLLMYISIYLSMYISIYRCIHIYLSIYMSDVYVYIYLSMYIHIYLSVYVFVYLSVYVYIYLSMNI